MEAVKKVVYLVTYLDDFKQKHMTFVTSFSEIRFIEERFYNVDYELLSTT